MRTLIGKLVRLLAPRTMANIADINTVREELGDLTTALHSFERRLEMVGLADLDGARRRVEDLTMRLQETEARVGSLEATIAELQEEIDETRRDGRRVAELYDLVFERLRAPQP
jgi:uncharacterized coiled-coil protein SlyX